MESPTKISAEELELLEQLFRDNLRESPINLEEYSRLAEQDEDIKLAFEEMLRYCLEYTEDVAEMEKYAREHVGKFDDERDELDQKRSRKHDATIVAINAFARTLTKKQIEVNWLKWGGQDRASYGNFAILTTLNRFKNEIILKKVIERHDVSIDFEKLRQNAEGAELLVIKYVETLTDILKEDTLSEDELDEQKPDRRLSELESIREDLGAPEEKILGAFHQMYLKRY